MNISPKFLASLAALAVLVACSEPSSQTTAPSSSIDERLVGEATLTIAGLPEGAEVVTMTWFPGRADDDPQGTIYPYSDGMTIPAGKLMFLIMGDGYESLTASRIPVYGETVLEAKMCKIGEGCYGTLMEPTPRD